MTRQERKLWYEFLKDCAQTFYRQRTIEDYIVDFCCPSKKIIIELDGSQHYEDAGMLSDRKRDSRLFALGYTVLRYSNRDIDKNFEAVKQDILNRMEAIRKKEILHLCR